MRNLLEGQPETHGLEADMFEEVAPGKTMRNQGLSVSLPVDTITLKMDGKSQGKAFLVREGGKPRAFLQEPKSQLCPDFMTLVSNLEQSDLEDSHYSLQLKIPRKIKGVFEDAVHHVPRGSHFKDTVLFPSL